VSPTPILLVNPLGLWRANLATHFRRRLDSDSLSFPTRFRIHSSFDRVARASLSDAWSHNLGLYITMVRTGIAMYLGTAAAMAGRTWLALRAKYASDISPERANLA
jgi:hypothetical protein